MQSAFEFLPGFDKLPTPNCIGVRFSYFEALFLTLQELEPEILFGLKKKHGLNIENVFFLLLKKMGVMVWGRSLFTKKKNFKMLPDKAFRFFLLYFENSG